MLFHGLSSFPVTPTDPDGRLLPDLFRLLLQRIADAGSDSVGILDTSRQMIELP